MVELCNDCFTAVGRLRSSPSNQPLRFGRTVNAHAFFQPGGSSWLNQPPSSPRWAGIPTSKNVHNGNETKRAIARRVDPGVGDWVALNENAITGIVERRTVS